MNSAKAGDKKVAKTRFMGDAEDQLELRADHRLYHHRNLLPLKSLLLDSAVERRNTIFQGGGIADVGDHKSMLVLVGHARCEGFANDRIA